MKTEQQAFANRLRSLFNIESYLLPELTLAQQHAFIFDPTRYFIHACDEQADAIWREISKRQVTNTEPANITEHSRKFSQTNCSE
jgi:hypothetical protein